MCKGYRGMLRDRCPKVVNYALIWCRAKEKWIDHVYSNFINVYVNKDDRNNATRLALGIKNGKQTYFSFARTINWDDLTEEKVEYWKNVHDCVLWFQKYYQYIENMYEISIKKDVSYFDIQVEIIDRFLNFLIPNKWEKEEQKEKKYEYVDDFSDYLLTCIEKGIGRSHRKYDLNINWSERRYD